MIYFISGHLDVSPEEFETHYHPRILAAAQSGGSFVVGDARGTDDLAQAFLATLQPPPSVAVYHMFRTPRNNRAFTSVGGFDSDEARDAAMTANSDADIAWIRPGRERSGTARNVARRLGRP